MTAWHPFLESTWIVAPAGNTSYILETKRSEVTPRFMNLAAALLHGHKCRRVNKCCCSMIEADCIRLVHFTRTRQLPTISMSAPPNEALMGVAQIGRSVKRPLSQQTTNSLSHLSALSSSALWPLFD